MRYFIAALVVVLAGMFAAAAGAVKPLSSISLNPNVPTVAFGSQVTFDVQTNETDFPWVETLCYQGDILVFGQTHGFFPAYLPDPIFTLGPTASWSSGEATCTATLFSYTNAHRRDLASVSFGVDAPTAAVEAKTGTTAAISLL